MAYGHAGCTLAAIAGLEAETRQLLATVDRLDQEQSAWLREAASPGTLSRPAMSPVWRADANGSPGAGCRAGSQENRSP